MSDFYAMQAEVLAARNQPKVKATKDKPAAPTIAAEGKVLYLVAAWNKQFGYWKIHRESNLDEFFELEKAEQRAAKLSSVWVSRKIIRVSLGE